MVIKDLFSHKIHSSGDDWPEKLIDIATIFSEFDGQIYDRSAIEERLSKISPRASKIARDPSKFRDEISAYPAYLGLYRVELQGGRWHIFLSAAAKQFLVCEEPNVSAFMLLQLALFQYPNGMGVAYKSRSDSVRIQANSRDRTLGFIENKVHLSPLRLICKGLQADSQLKAVSPLDAVLSLDEVFVLANDVRSNREASPPLSSVVSVLRDFREGKLSPIVDYESRFHILKHTDFLVSDHSGVRIRDPIGQRDANELIKKFELINSINIQFNGFDGSICDSDLLGEIAACSWGLYFDGVRTLESSIVAALTNEDPEVYSEFEEDGEIVNDKFEVIKSGNLYQLRKISFGENLSANQSKKRTIYTDPELTHVRRQRANLIHKVLLGKLHDFLESRGVESYENEHIDLFAKTPTQGKYVFEVKSISESNLLSQSRKGISQLYEYRYRYQDVIGYDVKLFLVFPCEPLEIEWLQEYLCTDRDIGIIWFNEAGELRHSPYCEKMLEPLLQMVAV